MTNETTPSRETSFEQLEERLNEALQRLEDPDAPLEERVERHREAVRLHARMDDVLDDARKALKATDEKDGTDRRSEEAVAGEEPYEKLLARLTAVVEALERDGLPLARVLELHREAKALADRCESILNSAQGTLEELKPGGNGSPWANAGGSRAEPPREPEDRHDAPF